MFIDDYQANPRTALKETAFAHRLLKNGGQRPFLFMKYVATPNHHL
jgi:hypothetical protein